MVFPSAFSLFMAKPQTGRRDSIFWFSAVFSVQSWKNSLSLKSLLCFPRLFLLLFFFFFFHFIIASSPFFSFLLHSCFLCKEKKKNLYAAIFFLLESSISYELSFLFFSLFGQKKFLIYSLKNLFSLIFEASHKLI